MKVSNLLVKFLTHKQLSEQASKLTFSLVVIGGHINTQPESPKQLTTIIWIRLLLPESSSPSLSGPLIYATYSSWLRYLEEVEGCHHSTLIDADTLFC